MIGLRGCSVSSYCVIVHVTQSDLVLNLSLGSVLHDQLNQISNSIKNMGWKICNVDKTADVVTQTPAAPSAIILNNDSQ